MSKAQSRDGARWQDKAQCYVTDCLGRRGFYLYQIITEL